MSDNNEELRAVGQGTMLFLCFFKELVRWFCIFSSKKSRNQIKHINCMADILLF